jgi:hypothetical protein
VNRDISEGGEPDGPRERKSARTSLEAEVQLRRSGHHHYMVNVYDISPTGCRIEFVERPRLDETVWVKFEGLDAIESTVCWLKASNAGVEFARPIYQPVFEALVGRLKN